MYKAPDQFNGQDIDSSPFDTPDGQRRTAFNEAQTAAMTKQIEADKRRVRPATRATRVVVSTEPGAYSYETPRSGR